MARNISEIMREGQEKTLEQVALLEKQMNGTITPEESTRLAMLTGNLLSLMKEAQAQGVGVGVGAGYGQATATANEVDEDEDDYSDEEYDDYYDDYDDYSDEDYSDEELSDDEVQPELCWCGDPDCKG